MKGVLIITILWTAAGITALGSEPSSPISAAACLNEKQVRIGQILGRRHRHHNHNNPNNNNVRYETRIVYKGNKTYRDTYRITWKNGKEKVKRVSRVRIS